MYTCVTVCVVIKGSLSGAVLSFSRIPEVELRSSSFPETSCCPFNVNWKKKKSHQAYTWSWKVHILYVKASCKIQNGFLFTFYTSVTLLYEQFTLHSFCSSVRQDFLLPCSGTVSTIFWIIHLLLPGMCPHSHGTFLVKESSLHSVLPLDWYCSL